MKETGNVDDKPSAQDDAEHGRIGEKKIGRERLSILGGCDCIHRIIGQIILPEVERLA